MFCGYVGGGDFYSIKLGVGMVLLYECFGHAGRSCALSNRVCIVHKSRVKLGWTRRDFFRFGHGDEKFNMGVGMQGERTAWSNLVWAYRERFLELSVGVEMNSLQLGVGIQGGSY